jgi:hypothetical protein
MKDFNADADNHLNTNHVKKAQPKALARAGTTKVFACDSAETGFDYFIFSESKALTQSIHAAIKGNPKFRAELQPRTGTEPAYAYYGGTGKHVVGVRALTSNGRSSKTAATPEPDPMACETLRQVLESRAEIRCIEHERLLALVKTLHAQLHALERTHRQAVPYFGLDDVVVVNDALALFINDDKLFAVRDAGTIDVTRAIGRDGAFYPPELSGGGKPVSLPYTVDARCAYYSFGMLVAYCATLNPALVTSASADGGPRSPLKLKRDVLGPIEGTKLYWFIVRCCAPDAARRCMLYV